MRDNVLEREREREREMQTEMESEGRECTQNRWRYRDES
jgi:hypothetical protein